MAKSNLLPDAKRIKSIASADFNQLLNIQVDSISSLTNVYTMDELQKWISYIKDETASRYENFNNLGYVNESNRLISFVSWTTQNDHANIECLYTLPPYRGKQIGKLLLYEAEANLKDKTIYVRSTLNARPFYERNGYTFTANDTSRAGFTISALKKQL